MIFDVDGTLVDSNDLHADCWVEAFAHFGKRVERDLVRGQIGKGGDLLVPDLCNAREMQRFGEESARQNDSQRQNGTVGAAVADREATTVCNEDDCR
jgi:beta-phosphoglucomutase-like phosphatase (HAD superfamily)